MSTQNQNQLTPALAFELFTELKSRSDASRWQKAVDGVSNLSIKVYGQLPTFQVIEGSTAYKATIFDSKRWSCACADFANRLQKKGAACRHLGAVALLSFLPLACQSARERGASPLADELEALRASVSQAQARIEEEAERQAIQEECAPSLPADPPPPEKAANDERQTESEVKPDNPQPSAPSPNATPHMTLKRSLSPDGRIDALSIEIDIPITKTSTASLQEQALKLIFLQDAIGQSYLRHLQEKEKQSNGQSEPKTPAKGSPSAPATGSDQDGRSETPQKARLVEVGQTDTQYGKRLVVSFELAGGRKAKLFGSEKAIAKQLAAVGLKLESIQLGKRLNVPCLVLTKMNGKFLNIDRIFPPAQ